MWTLAPRGMTFTAVERAPMEIMEDMWLWFELLVVADRRKQAELEEELMQLFATFELHGGPYHTDVVMAKSQGRLIGGLADDSILQLSWYRTAGSANDQFVDIEGQLGETAILE